MASEFVVTVAVTPAFELVFDVPDGPTYGASYDELPKTEVKADGGQTLREVLRIAADQLGVRPAAIHLDALQSIARQDGRPWAKPHVADMLVWVGFRRPDDDEVEYTGDDYVVRRRQQRLSTTDLVVRDDRGRAVWRKPGLDATLAELLDAAQVGLMDGSPLEPYLIPSIPQGDPGTLGEWARFIDALKVLWQATEIAATAGGAWGFFELITQVQRRRSPMSIEAVERRAPEWTDRGAAPADLFRLLIAKPRSTEETAALLGCSPDEANAILWAFGFVCKEDGLWEYKADPPAALLGDDVDLVFADAFQWPDWEERLEEFESDRLDELGTTGTPPSLDEGKVRVREIADAHFDDLPSDEPGLLQRLMRRLLRREW
ncbi:MAG: hypothetical protein QOJ82_286 [Solirubrobacteraceae bacterium]|jgi:hypothetical protein|nr:hypothetical protein [Solirubrobacteraceae bacterium]